MMLFSIVVCVVTVTGLGKTILKTPNPSWNVEYEIRNWVYQGTKAVNGFVFPTLVNAGEHEEHEGMLCRLTEGMMKAMLPYVYVQKEYGEPLELSENEIPDGFYQEEDTKEAETIRLLEECEGELVEEPSIPVFQKKSNEPAPQPGKPYALEQLNQYEFLMNQCYVVDASTMVYPEEMHAGALLSRDFRLDPSGEGYKILIYHTHGSESFCDSREGVIEDTIIGVGDELTRILQEVYGWKVYHDTTVYDVIDGKLDRNYAYTASGNGIDAILAQNPSIEVVVDLHRDGVGENTHLVTTVNGKPTAKIMLLNGVSRLKSKGEISYLTNPNRQDNLAFALQLYLAGQGTYPDFMRKTYIRGYLFNLDRKPRATLIEVGGQTNTLQEAKNAMEPLAGMLHQVLTQENAYTK